MVKNRGTILEYATVLQAAKQLQKQPATEKEFQPAWQAYKYLLRGKLYAYIGVNDQNGRPIITLKARAYV